MVTLNLYFKDKENLMVSQKIESDNKFNIDVARSKVIQELDKLYLDSKYKVELFTAFSGETQINVIFENEIFIKRDFLLNKILND